MTAIEKVHAKLRKEVTENPPWLLTYLTSNRFILYTCIFTVMFLTPNTYYVFHSFCVFLSPYREIASAGVALIIASAIMIYTLRKNQNQALFFAWFEVSISVYYYVMTIVRSDEPYALWGLIPALSFALILPYSVRGYANEIRVPDDEPDLVSIKELEKYMDENPTDKPSDYWNKKKFPDLTPKSDDGGN
jgi:hypothetical protein